ncbi:MAG TPA: hypothetical protein VGQ54_12765, partial [Burkholderiales bacterium]|nr:hypothetical protein [Burkholderiales bacterium]
LEVWQKYVQAAGTRRIAVLNKIDLMWDGLKAEPEIADDVERQLESTSTLLTLPRTHVLAISAQKALLARIRGDNDLLAKSGVEQLEQLLASEIIPSKQEILRAAVQREIGGMVDASRLAVANQLSANQTQLNELAAMSGKNRNLAQAMVARLEADRKAYQTTIKTFRSTYNTVMNQGATLVKQLDEDALEQILNKDREFIQGAWTTAGLWKNMQLLFDHFAAVSNKILNFSKQIKGLVDATYIHFHEKFGFAKMTPPALNLEKHTLSMTALKETAKQFCRDPLNVMTEKHFLVSRFYNSLVAKARQIFEMTRLDAQNWLRWALNPLDMQIKGHEQVLTKRIENFKTIRDNINSVEDRMKHLEKQQAVLQQQSQVLARIRRSLDGEALPEEEPAAQREAVQVA